MVLINVFVVLENHKYHKCGLKNIQGRGKIRSFFASKKRASQFFETRSAISQDPIQERAIEPTQVDRLCKCAHIFGLMCTKFEFCAEVEYRPIAIGPQRIAHFSITTFQIQLWTLLLMTCFGRWLIM